MKGIRAEFDRFNAPEHDSLVNAQGVIRSIQTLFWTMRAAGMLVMASKEKDANLVSLKPHFDNLAGYLKTLKVIK